VLKLTFISKFFRDLFPSFLDKECTITQFGHRRNEKNTLSIKKMLGKFMSWKNSCIRFSTCERLGMLRSLIEHGSVVMKCIPKPKFVLGPCTASQTIEGIFFFFEQGILLCVNTILSTTSFIDCVPVFMGACKTWSHRVCVCPKRLSLCHAWFFCAANCAYFCYAENPPRQLHDIRVLVFCPTSCHCDMTLMW